MLDMVYTLHIYNKPHHQNVLATRNGTFFNSKSSQRALTANIY